MCSGKTAVRSKETGLFYPKHRAALGARKVGGCAVCFSAKTFAASPQNGIVCSS